MFLIPDMNNEFFFIFRKNRFSHLFLRFFADVCKIFTLTFLGNGSTDFAEIYTQVSYHYCGGPEPLTYMKYTVFEKLLGKPKIVIFRASADLTKDPATGKIFKVRVNVRGSGNFLMITEQFCFLPKSI